MNTIIVYHNKAYVFTNIWYFTMNLTRFYQEHAFARHKKRMAILPSFFVI